MRGRSRLPGQTRWIAAILAACPALGTAQDASYNVQLSIFRVSGPITVLSHEYANQPANPRIEEFLDRDTNVQLNNVHVAEFLESFGKLGEINWKIEPGLIAPPPARPTIPVEKNVSPTTQYFTDGMLQTVDFEGVPFREALKRTLAYLDLDFVVLPDGIQILRRGSLLPGAAHFRTYTSLHRIELFEQGAVRILSTTIPLGGDDHTVSVLLLETDKVKALGRPAIVLLEDQAGTISVGSSVPVPYLEPKPGSAEEFVLRKSIEDTAVNTRVRVSRLSDRKVNLTATVETRYIKDREPLADTTLRAGPPIRASSNTGLKVPVDLGRRFALLAPIADGTDETLLAFCRIDRMPGRPATPVSGSAQSTPAVEAPTSQYTVEMKFLQVHGEPDWSFWTQPYDRPYSFDEGAGRVLGPVGLHEPLDPERMHAQLGFRDTTKKDMEFVSAPRATGLLDHQSHIDSGATPGLFKLLLTNSARQQTNSNSITPNTDAASNRKGFTGIGELLNPIYDSLASHPKKLEREDVEGKILIIDANVETDASGKNVAAPPGQGDGIFIALEGKSGDAPGQYRLEQTVVLRKKLGNKLGAATKGDAVLATTQFACDYQTDDGDSAMFLIPVSGDSYLVMISKFEVVKPES